MHQLNQQAPEAVTRRPDGVLEFVGQDKGVFFTIQGEGPFAGEPAVFVRLAGCNFECPDCFGVGVKARIPYLTRSVGPKVRLDEVTEGEKILTFDADMQLVETTVKKIIKRTVKKWLTLRIAGKAYDVTREHPFFTNRGMVLACDLRVGDQILEARPNEIIAFKKMGDRNPMTDPEVSARKAANTDWAAMGQKVSSTIQEQKQSGTYRTTWDRMTPKQRRRVRRKQREDKLGEKNPNWNGLAPNLKTLRREVSEGIHTRCQKCRKKKNRLLVHHRDEDMTNDDRSNLAVWCHRCHNRHHERGYNFWNGKRSDGKELVKAHNGQEVEFIQKHRGELPVVNISCAPYNTYLANGMFVHNCDTDYTSSRIMAGPCTLANLVDDAFPPAASAWRDRLVVITGGEPFRQNVGPFVRELLTRGFKVQVETNGSLFLEDFPYCGDVTIVASPKAGRVHEKLRPYVKHLKYVVEAGRQHSQTRLPVHVLGNKAAVEPPWADFVRRGGTVWVQPSDMQNDECNAANVEACVAAAKEHGYRVSLQTHKILGVE